MLAVDLGPGGEFRLIFRLESLFAIPPSAAAIEVISNVRGADNRHVSPPSVGPGEPSIAQIF